MVYADFECILVVEYNRKQNPNESYTNEYQKHVACNYVINQYVLMIKFSKLFKSYLGEDGVYKFISSVVEVSKYQRCDDKTF